MNHLFTNIETVEHYDKQENRWAYSDPTCWAIATVCLMKATMRSGCAQLCSALPYLIREDSPWLTCRPWSAATRDSWCTVSPVRPACRHTWHGTLPDTPPPLAITPTKRVLICQRTRTTPRRRCQILVLKYPLQRIPIIDLIATGFIGLRMRLELIGKSHETPLLIVLWSGRTLYTRCEKQLAEVIDSHNP